MNILPNQQSFKVEVAGVKMNDQLISKRWKTAFIDSGTTYVYLPKSLFSQIRRSFDTFCNKGNNCARSRVGRQNYNKICFHFDEKKWPQKKDFFKSFPVLTFDLPKADGKVYALNWYASEYLFIGKG